MSDGKLGVLTDILKTACLKEVDVQLHSLKTEYFEE